MPQENRSLTVLVRSDHHGYWVEWNKDGETGSLGPYEDTAMAEHVRTAKEREFTENKGDIDDAKG